MELWNHLCYLILATFIASKRNPVVTDGPHSLPCEPASSMTLLLWTFHRNGFLGNSALECSQSSCCSTRRYFISFLRLTDIAFYLAIHWLMGMWACVPTAAVSVPGEFLCAQCLHFPWIMSNSGAVGCVRSLLNMLGII